MIKPLQKCLFSFLFLLLSATAFCQSGTTPADDDSKAKNDDKTADAKSSIKFGVSYLSNNVFMGRADSVTTPVIIPEAKYTLKMGIYFSGSLDFIPKKPTHKLDGGDLSAGYDFDITDNLSGGTSFTKLFYSSSSTQIASSVSATFNANLNYDIADIITPSVSIDYDLNKGGIGNDFFLTPGIAHDFIVQGVFGDLDIFIISPTVSLNTGTQNFYDAYLNKRQLRSARLTKVEDAVLAQYEGQLGQFALLDYEISAPLEYKTGHFIFHFTPTYAIVQNQLPKAIAAQLSDQSSIFYFEVGASLKF